MGVCWYCYWGWSKKVAEIYQEALRQLGKNESPLHFGPGHIVWEDENFNLAEWCLEHFDEHLNDYTDGEMKIVKWSLEELAKLPLNIRCPKPDNYDGEYPALYPPRIEMVKV